MTFTSARSSGSGCPSPSSLGASPVCSQPAGIAPAGIQPLRRFGLGATPSVVTNAASVSLALGLGVASSSLPAWPPSALIMQPFSTSSPACRISKQLGCCSSTAPLLRPARPAPEHTRAFAAEHDRSLIHCLADLLQFERPDLHRRQHCPACFSPRRARSEAPCSTAACWASWADSLPSLAVRAPDVFAALLPQLESPQPDSASAHALCDARQRLFDLGFGPPPWTSITREGPPEPVLDEDPSEDRQRANGNGSRSRLNKITRKWDGQPGSRASSASSTSSSPTFGHRRAQGLRCGPRLERVGCFIGRQARLGRAEGGTPHWLSSEKLSREDGNSS